MLGVVAGRSVGERDTKLGREVASRWLGVRDWLRNVDAFADLPPSAVMVWDRYLGFGAAVGATRVASAVIDLGMGNRKRVWSSYGGRWRRIKVRHPRWWARYGQTAPPLITKALVAGVFGLALFTQSAKALARFEAPDLVGTVLLLGALALMAYAAYVIVRVVIDLSAPATVTGQVLWAELWKQTSGGENSPPRPLLHYVAIDEGTADTTTAWALPNDLRGHCVEGDTVTITVRRWSRRITKIVVVERGTIRAVDASLPRASADPENLIAAAMGLPVQGRRTVPSGTATGAPEPPLVTDDEVSQVLGFPCSAGDGSMPAPFGRVAIFRGPDGAQVMFLGLMSGMPGKMAMRLRHRGHPLPGIGDEAQVGEGWAIGRRGENVVLLQLDGPARSANPHDICGLLQTALSRLPASLHR